MFGFFNSPPKEKAPEKELSPKELLIKKYTDLIWTNGLTYEIIPGEYPKLKIAIIGTDIEGYLSLTAYNPMKEVIYRRESIESYKWFHGFLIDTIGQLGISRDYIVLKSARSWIHKQLRIAYEEKNRKEKMERDMREAKQKQDEDKKYMDEYLRISGIKTNDEFDPHFKILREIEQLTKDQSTLAETWKTNTELIIKKREQFYSIKP